VEFTDPSDEIIKLIDQVKDEHWDLRKLAFEGLSKYLGNNATALPNFTLFEKII